MGRSMLPDMQESSEGQRQNHRPGDSGNSKQDPEAQTGYITYKTEANVQTDLWRSRRQEASHRGFTTATGSIVTGLDNLVEYVHSTFQQQAKQPQGHQ